VLYGGQSQFCVRNIGVFTLTGDRSLIVVTSIDSDGTLCTLDPVTGKQTAVASGREFVYQVTPTPDGKSLLLPIYPSGQIAVFNAHTLAQTSTLTVSGDTSSAASMIVSPDSSTLYISGSGILYAYDLTSGAAVGWMSSLDVQPVSGGMAVGPVNSPNLQAFDGTGLLAGPMEEGVGFLDTKRHCERALSARFLPTAT
jgi:WD40 repeat protein